MGHVKLDSCLHCVYAALGKGSTPPAVGNGILGTFVNMIGLPGNLVFPHIPVNVKLCIKLH